jgi:hypothetical protein
MSNYLRKFGVGFLGMLVVEVVIAHEMQSAPEASRATFGGNLFLDPCTNGCNYNPEPSGYAVLGPSNCTAPGVT